MFDILYFLFHFACLWRFFTYFLSQLVRLSSPFVHISSSIVCLSSTFFRLSSPIFHFPSSFFCLSSLLFQFSIVLSLFVSALFPSKTVLLFFGFHSFMFSSSWSFLSLCFLVSLSSLYKLRHVLVNFLMSFASILPPFPFISLSLSLSHTSVYSHTHAHTHTHTPTHSLTHTLTLPLGGDIHWLTKHATFLLFKIAILYSCRMASSTRGDNFQDRTI